MRWERVEVMGEVCGRKLGLGGFVEGAVGGLREVTLKVETCLDWVLSVGGAGRV